MSQTRRLSVFLVVLGVLASLLTLTTVRTATASEVMPELLWPAVTSDVRRGDQMTTSPRGDLTVGCNYEPGEPQTQDLTTYSPTGAILRQIDRTAPIEGQAHNCIAVPVVDKHGDLYGRPAWSNYMEAYDGNGTLKWAHFIGACASDPTVGADGNIYFIANGHLVGMNPNLASGETQPTKVMDVDLNLGLGCSALHFISAYNGGLITWGPVGSSSWTDSRTRYISYSGTIVSDTEEHSGKLNTEGYRFISGMPTSVDEPVRVSKFSPITQDSAWSVDVSPPGVETTGWGASTYPTPNGGVVAHVREYRLDNGIPVTPTEYIEKLVYLSSSGQKIWTMELRGQDINTTPFGSRIAVDVSGNLAIVRNLVNQVSAGVLPSVEIKVVNLATQNVLYSGEVRGNQDETDSTAYGYKAVNIDTSGLIGPGAVYINTAPCTDYDCYTYQPQDLKLRAIKVPGLSMDYPRGAILGVTPGAICENVIFIAVAGSDQHYDGPKNLSISPEVETAYEGFKKVLTPGKTIRVRVIDYPALPVETITRRLKLGEYLTGKNTGVRRLRNLVSVVRESCPDQKIVLAGYSQGALVVHEYAVEHANSTTGDDKQAIAAIITIADPAQIKNSSVLNFADAPTNAMGICQYTGVYCFKNGKAVDIPQAYVGRTTTVCKIYDIVCDTQRLVDSTLPVPAAAYDEGVTVHATYDADPNVVMAGKRAARQVNNRW